MPTAEKTRQAREFLRKGGLKGIRPRHLAAGAEDLGQDFSETLGVLADLMDAGQGQGPSPETQDLK